MANKTTVTDVAKAAGVSVATVSYVMNNRQDQKISPETRKKVLQMANLMNYVPSHAAKSLATGKNNVIGICYKMDTGVPTYLSEITDFASLLIERLNRMHIDAMFVPVLNEVSTSYVNHNVDVLITIGLSHTEFKAIADCYLVPVIAVDMLVNDTLFYQIYEDYPSLIDQALIKLGATDISDVVLVHDRFYNDAYRDFVYGDRKFKRIITSDELYNMSVSVRNTICNEKIIVIGSYLSLQVKGIINASGIIDDGVQNAVYIMSEGSCSLLPASSSIICNNYNKKANLTINISLNAINRNFNVAHDHKVL